MAARYVTISPEHPEAIALAAQIASASKLVSVPLVEAKKRMPHINCYWNVAVAAMWAKGSSIQQGWQFHWWPNRYVVATHHAVLKNADGSLVDVTQGVSTDSAVLSEITFLPDDTVKANTGEFVPISSRFRIIDDNPAVHRVLAEYELMHNATVDKCQYLNSVGYRSQENWKMAGMTFGAAEFRIPTPEVAKEITRYDEIKKAGVNRFGLATIALRALDSATAR